MINTKLIQDLTRKEMSRKQFLQLVGAAILSVIGFTAFLKNLDKFATTQTRQVKTKAGYGSSPYGN